MIIKELDERMTLYFKNVYHAPLADKDKEHFHLSQTVESSFLCNCNGLVNKITIMCSTILSVFRYSTQKLDNILSFHTIALGL